jgi:hypothetical protein
VEDVPVIRREDSEEEDVNLQDLPTADEFPPVDDVEDVSDAGSLFVDDDEDHQAPKRPRVPTDASLSDLLSEPSAKRRKDAAGGEESDDKKKLAMSTTYEGFAIYGRVLCLVVKRKDSKGKRTEGQVMMEDWIASTQMPADDDGS